MKKLTHGMKVRSGGMVLIIVSIVLAACQMVVAPHNESEMAAGSAGSAVHSVSFSATDSGFDGPDTLQAGWTELALVNQGENIHQMVLFRFLEGKGMADLQPLAEVFAPGIPAWLASVGGPNGVLPGQSNVGLVELLPGDYVMMDLSRDPEGVRNVAHGLIKPLTVEAAENAAMQAEFQAPESDVTLELVDFQFNLSTETITAGDQRVHVVNTGVEPHEVALIELVENAQMADFVAALAAGERPPGKMVGGLTAVHTDQDGYFTATFEMGKRYGLICFVPSVANNATPHFMMGMVSDLTVTN